MYKQVSFLTLKNRLILMVLLTTLIPITIISYFVENNIEKKAKGDFLSFTKKEIIQADNITNTYLESIFENCKLLSINPTIEQGDYSITSYINKTGNEKGLIKMTPSQNWGIERDIYQVYTNFVQACPNTFAVYFAGKDGGYVQWPEGLTKEKYDPRESSWYKSALEHNGKVVKTGVYPSGLDKQIVVSTAVAVKDKAGRIIGVQGLDVKLNGLKDIVKEIKIGHGGYILLLNQDGTILLSQKNPDWNFTTIKNLKIEQLNKVTQLRDGLVSITLDGKNYLANVYNSPKTDWKFVVFIPENEIMKTANEIRNTIIIIALFFLIISIVVSLLFFDSFSQPLVAAIEHLKIIASGDFSETIQERFLSRKDELGQLFQELNIAKESMAHLFSQIRSSAGDVSSSSQELVAIVEKNSRALEEISNAMEKIDQKVTSQAVSIAVGINQIESLAKTIEVISQSTDEIDRSFQQTFNFTVRGLGLITSLLEKSKENKDAIKNISEIVITMDRQSKEIDMTVNHLREIANQTNRLALNGAMEAAQAGEYGRRFAMVAEELRQLAEQSAQAISNIRYLMDNIGQQSFSAVQVLDKANQLSYSQEGTVEQTGQIFQEVADLIESLKQKIQQVQEFNGEMISKKEEIIDLIANISSSAKETAKDMENVSAATREQLPFIEKTLVHLVDLITLVKEKLEKSINHFITK